MALFRQESAEQSEAPSEQQREEAVEATAQTGTDPAVVAAAASILLSWHQFFLRGNRELGLFIAFWPPTILAFASYFNQTEMSDEIKDVV